MKSNSILFKCMLYAKKLFLCPLFIFSFISLTYTGESDETLFSDDTGNILTYNDSIPVLIPYPSPTFKLKPKLKWHKLPIEVTKYYIQISISPLFTSTIVYVSAIDTTYKSAIDLPIDTIYWRVKADEFDWSDVDTFIIEDGRIPDLIPYENPTFERKPTLQWHTPPVQVTSFSIQISTDSLFATTEIDIAVVDTFYTCVADLPTGMIYWRVKSNESVYSNVNSFEIIDYRIPVIIPYEPKLTNETKPELSWKSVDSANIYTIEIDNNSDFGSTILSMPINVTTFIPFEPFPVGDIYWRVKSNLVDSWSDVDHFIILADTIPLLIRYNGKTIIEKKPLFAWHPVSDTNLKEISYKIMIADNISFSDSITQTLNDTFYVPVNDLNYGKWFWKVSCSRNLDLYSPVDSLVIDSMTKIIKHNNGFKKAEVYFQVLQGAVRIIYNGFPKNEIRANIYNVKGRLVSTLKPAHKKSNFLIWNYKDNNGYDVTSGLYIIRLNVEEKVYIHEVILSK